ncbi:MAG TPA: polysaccharide deacetylase family protein [Gemmatimonadaceae bacterium]|nr:polysaccharide deacetylase family protein [Gemmatimonadaceae bacterium]
MSDGSLTVCLTADVEPDCPPYLWTWRGIEEGMPRLLDLLDAEHVPATLFTTGDVARRYPAMVRDAVRRGHELACHGVSHRAFDDMDRATAAREIDESAATLRAFAPVVSFRAPYLRFPDAHLPLLENAAFQLDSSLAKYKLSYRRPRAPTMLLRVPASVTSSVLRLPRVVRRPYLRALASPLVLFVHPWELVDFRHSALRLDCRFRTGEPAVRCLREVIGDLRRRGARFVRMRELLPGGAPSLAA